MHLGNISSLFANIYNLAQLLDIYNIDVTRNNTVLHL
jgi:hypothetical protein